MKTLVICRHAKSDWSHDLEDFDRPLNNRGRKDAPSMGRMLSVFGLQPDLIISSPAVRALSTAKLVAKEIRYAAESIREERRFYDSTPVLSLGIIQDQDDNIDTLMVFGHNPTWEQLAKFLLKAEAEVVMPTCGMICIEFPTLHWQDLGSVRGSLKWHVIPKLLSGQDG